MFRPYIKRTGILVFIAHRQKEKEGPHTLTLTLTVTHTHTHAGLPSQIIYDVDRIHITVWKKNIDGDDLKYDVDSNIYIYIYLEMDIPKDATIVLKTKTTWF